MRSSKPFAITVLALTFIAASATQTQAAQARSSMTVSVQVINPCEVTVGPGGKWISFGCEDASFDFSTFSTSEPQTGAVSATATSPAGYVDVTY